MRRLWLVQHRNKYVQRCIIWMRGTGIVDRGPLNPYNAYGNYCIHLNRVFTTVKEEVLIECA